MQITPFPSSKLAFSKAGVFLALALFFGFLFDYFFYGNALGISFPIYIGLVVVSVLAVCFFYKIKVHSRALWVVLPLLFFSIMVGIRANSTLTFLNVLGAFLFLLLFFNSLVGRKIYEYLFVDYYRLVFSRPLRFLEQGRDFFVYHLPGAMKGHTLSKQIVKGLIVSLPVLFIFLVLFSSADLVFNKFVTNAIHLDSPSLTFMRVILIGVTALFFAGLFFSISEDSLGTQTVLDQQHKKYFGVVETSIFFGLLNVLFLVFIVIQFIYLFGGEANITAQGFTYAEYVHKGFFELVAVALLSFSLIFVAEKFIEKSEKGHLSPFKILTGIFVVQVMVIMASAFMRMVLYENAYGFTELRLYTHIFIVWLAVISVLLFYKILFSKKENVFAFHFLISLVVFLTGLNFLNPDAFIVRQNLERYSLTGKLDVYYLSTLSYDALPEMIKIYDLEDKSFIYLWTRPLTHRREFSPEVPWQSWTLSYQNGQEVIQNLK